MKQISVTRRIAAPLERVFATVSDISQFSQAVPQIIKVEFLTEQRVGLGTRFRETRVMKGHEHVTELDVTEFVDNERIRLVADEGGTIWDTVFTVSAVADQTELAMVMEARPYKLLAKLGMPMIRGMIVRAIEDDMDAVKAWCEQPPQTG